MDLPSISEQTCKFLTVTEIEAVPNGRTVSYYIHSWKGGLVPGVKALPKCRG